MQYISRKYRDLVQLDREHYQTQLVRVAIALASATIVLSWIGGAHAAL